MPQKLQNPPLAFLEGLEDREKLLQKRLARVCRRIPKTSSLFSSALSGPVSLRVEAHHLDGRFDQAVSVAQEAVEASPGVPDAWVAFAKALACVNQTDEARLALNQAKHLYSHGNQSPSPEFTYLRAVLTRDDRRALEIALAACEADRSYPEALFLASRLAAKLGYPLGPKILNKIGPLMDGSVQRKLYEKITARPIVRRSAN